MANKQTVVVISGAGISAESGLATFRDAGGLWEQYSVEDLASPLGWQRNPQVVLDFYNSRRAKAVAAEPNPAHLALAQLEQSYDVQIITQNIDDLHERAGSTHVLHLHGEIRKARSEKNPALIVELGEKPIHLGDCAQDGEQLRPHVVWFGEDVPAIELASEIVCGADKVLVVGTSLAVYPAAGLLGFAKPSAERVIVTLELDSKPQDFVWLRGKAATELPKLVANWLSEAE